VRSSNLIGLCLEFWYPVTAVSLFVSLHLSRVPDQSMLALCRGEKTSCFCIHRLWSFNLLGLEWLSFFVPCCGFWGLLVSAQSFWWLCVTRGGHTLSDFFLSSTRTDCHKSCLLITAASWVVGMNMNLDWHPVKLVRIWFQNHSNASAYWHRRTRAGDRSVESANLHVNSRRMSRITDMSLALVLTSPCVLHL